MNSIIVPAIIAKSQSELMELLNKIKGKVERVQLDFMDGKFVPNKSLDFNFEIPEYFEYEAHLMVDNPLKLVDKIKDKVKTLILHIETLNDVKKEIECVKKTGKKVNLALIPDTQIVAIKNFIRFIDGVLIMTVDPGSYCINKEFNKKTLKKIEQLRGMNKNIPIEVDGCINPKNALLCKKAGANIFASGSYIFKSNNIDIALKELKKVVS